MPASYLMDKIKFGFVFMYYCFFKFEEAIETALQYLSPFTLFVYLNDLFRNKTSEEHVRPKIKKEMLWNKDGTINWARGDLTCFLLSILIIVFNIALGRLWASILSNNFIAIVFLLVMVLFGLAINKIKVFRNQQYSEYFQKIERLGKVKKHFYMALFLIIVILDFLCFLYSFNNAFQSHPSLSRVI